MASIDDTNGHDSRDTTGGERDAAASKRDASGTRRDVKSDSRDGAADARDTVAADRDLAADLRDRAADARDAETARSRASNSTPESAAEAYMRINSASDRKWSSEGRYAAGMERGQSSADRDESTLDRGFSAADRLFSLHERDRAAMDALTGSYLRGPGLGELAREMERASRTKSPLVLAFMDVDGLKVVNDERGHAAGDQVMRSVVRILEEKLRLYDRIVRYGGDEFVCALSNMTEADAAVRFADVNAALAQEPIPGSITFGLATMMAGDSVDSLIARADKAMYRKRGRG